MSPSGRALNKPGQYRLPEWAHEFLAEEAERYGVTKTQVIVRALERLRDSEIEALMAQGYRDLVEENLATAEEGLVVAAETLEDW